MVPYAYQVIFLAEAFRVSKKPGENASNLLEAWFWLTTMGGAFAGISGYRLGLVAGDLRRMVRREQPSWSFPRPFTYTQLPTKVDFKAVRIKGLALRLAARQETGRRVLIEQRNRSLLPLFPGGRVSKKRYSSPGNRVLSGPEEIISLRDKAFNAPTEVADELHVISEQARHHLCKGELDAFIEARKKDLENDELRFISTYAELFGFQV